MMLTSAVFLALFTVCTFKAPVFSSYIAVERGVFPDNVTISFNRFFINMFFV